MDNKDKKIQDLEHRLLDLESKPYRCEVCGKPTDGYYRVLFWTHYYCRDHFPPGGYMACANTVM